MKCVFAFLLIALAAFAQSGSNQSPNDQDSHAATKVDPKRHSDALRLVEASGVKQRIQDNVKPMVELGRKQMMEKCPGCETFANEWSKRMVERLKVDDFVAVYVRVYEKYFTDEELLELIALQSVKNGSDATAPSAALKDRLSAVMPSVLGETIGGCAEIGARLGSQIGAEIEKEHPEYVKPKSSDAAN